MRKIEDIPDGELFSMFMSYFTVQRAVILLGFMVMWAARGRADDLAQYREEMMSSGYGRTATYDALMDLRKFREYVEGSTISPYDSASIFGVMGKLIDGCVSV